MPEKRHPRTRVALACERFARELSACEKDFEAARAAMERISELPFAEADDVEGARLINALTDELRPILLSAFAPIRKNVEEFERTLKKISADGTRG